MWRVPAFPREDLPEEDHPAVAVAAEDRREAAEATDSKKKI